MTALYAEGLTAAFALAEGPVSLEDSMAATEELLRRRSAMLARVWRAAREARP
jgi:glycerate kinase